MTSQALTSLLMVSLFFSSFSLDSFSSPLRQESYLHRYSTEVDTLSSTVELSYQLKLHIGTVVEFGFHACRGKSTGNSYVLVLTLLLLREVPRRRRRGGRLGRARSPVRTWDRCRPVCRRGRRSAGGAVPDSQESERMWGEGGGRLHYPTKQPSR